MRQATRLPYEFTSPVSVAMMPQAVAMKAIQRRGVNLLSTRFDGTSKAMYVTKRMDTAVWYWLPTSPRSASKW